MPLRARFILALTVILLVPAAARAQEPRFHLGAKGGLTVERSEDRLTGTVPALGLTAAATLTRNWRAEFEFWLPGYLDDERGEPKHRDILYSFAALRTFEAARMRPYLAAGFTMTRTEDWFTFCSANRVPPGGGGAVPTMVSCDEPDVIDVRREKNVGRDGYLLVGGGVDVPLARRVSLVADVRVNLAPASVLVRPSLGLSIAF